MGAAIFTGVTGLLAQQTKLDVIANNIANVNTTGYRGSRVIFQDLFSQTLEGGTAATSANGGTNPLQRGLGVGVASVDVNYAQGTLTDTGVATDLAVDGNGFFVLRDSYGVHFTRDGSFSFNSDGVLIDPATGARVQGYMADENEIIDPTAEPTDLIIPLGTTSVVAATENANLTGNLNSDAALGTTVERAITVYDSLGTPRQVQLTFTKIDQVDDGSGTLYNAWSWTAEFDGTDVTNVVAGETGVLLFDADGVLHAEGSLSAANVFTNRSALPSQFEVSIPTTAFTGPSVPTTPLEFNMVFSGVTELSDESDLTLASQDGFPRGVLESFSIGRDGVITGTYTNGMTRSLGQVSLATFSNIGGLARRGDNMFDATAASGLAQLGAPSAGGRGTIAGGTLEGSNVDLATEFSNMIITQRGYQANARTVTTADALLQEAVNLVR